MYALTCTYIVTLASPGAVHQHDHVRDDGPDARDGAGRGRHHAPPSAAPGQAPLRQDGNPQTLNPQPDP